MDCVAGNIFRTQTSPAIPTAYYIGLSQTPPTDSGSNVTEPPTSHGYARLALNSLSAPSNGTVTNTSDISFPESTGDWGVISHFVIYDSQAAGSGNLLMYGELSAPRTVEEATMLLFPAGELELRVQNPS
ncbi:phage tail fiber protein [Intestinimonas butyriciproducens]|uniref:phage tail fiber protein n=1 Tax=Intestinimonas butyriciproducens TaxID=1297617 RepID=UPI003C6D9536